MGQGSPGTEEKGGWAGNPSLGKGGAGTRGVRRHPAPASGQVTPLGCAALICPQQGPQWPPHCYIQWSVLVLILLTSNTADPS